MQTKIKLINNTQKSWILALLCIIGYCLTYFGRINYSAALAEMLSQNVLTKMQGGTIATIYFTIYGIGQVFNGMLADRYSPFHQVTIGLFGTAALNLCMAIPQGYYSMLLVWGLNGYFQSLLWTPLLRIVATNIKDSMRHKAIVWLNAAPAIGTAAIYLLCSVVLKFKPWPYVFIGAGFCLGVFSIIWLFGLRYCLRDAETISIEHIKNTHTNAPANATLFGLLLSSGAIFAFLPHMVHGMLKDGITTWAPTYLTEVFTLSTSNAVAISIILPLIGVFGAHAASHLQLKLRNEFTCVTLLFGMTTGTLVLLILFGHLSVLLSALLFAIVITCMHGINVLFVSFVPVHFAAYGKTSTISGLLNATAHLGGAFSMFVVATISERFGWIAPQLLWVSTSCISVVFCTLGIKKWSKAVATRYKIN